MLLPRRDRFEHIRQQSDRRSHHVLVGMQVIKAVRTLARSGREPDESERRVLREYARAWRVPLPADPLPVKSAIAQVAKAFVELFVR